MTFERSRHLQPGSEVRADVCIVGSGAAGITIARQLDGSGLQVVVLEAGGTSRVEATETDDFAIDHVGLPVRDDIESRGRWFGGSTNLWFGRIAVPEPIDFERRAWVPHSGWPISYEEGSRWFDVAAEILDVKHFDKISIRNWPANPTNETFARAGGLDLGVFLWADDMYMGKRARRGLRASRNVRVFLDATVTQLVLEGSTTSISGVAVAGPAGRRFTVTASAYVLAAGGLENPRLLLSSRERLPAGVGNQHGNVGRYFLEHPLSRGRARVALRDLPAGQVERLQLLGEKARSAYGKVQLRVTLDERRQRDEGLLNNSLHAYLVADAHKSAAYESARRLREAARRRRPPARVDLARDVGQIIRAAPQLAGFALRKAAHRLRPTELVIVDQMEQEPDPESRLTIADRQTDRYGIPRLSVDWRVSGATLRSQRRLHELFRDRLNAVGIHTFRSELLDDVGAAATLLDMRHPAGTTRMSASPAGGVVDSNCRVHGLDNLYVAGGSTFPTSGHFNPTLLIVALAARLADHLAGTTAAKSRLAPLGAPSTQAPR